MKIQTTLFILMTVVIVNATYSTTYPDYDDNDDDDDSSYWYIGEKTSKPDKTSSLGTFDVHNYTDSKIKQYSYWYHTKPDEEPPAGLVALYVAHFYCQEIAFLDNEEIKGNFVKQNIEHCQFLHGMCETYYSLSSSDAPNIFDMYED